MTRADLLLIIIAVILGLWTFGLVICWVGLSKRDEIVAGEHDGYCPQAVVLLLGWAFWVWGLVEHINQPGVAP